MTELQFWTLLMGMLGGTWGILTLIYCKLCEINQRLSNIKAHTIKSVEIKVEPNYTPEPDDDDEEEED